MGGQVSRQQPQFLIQGEKAPPHRWGRCHSSSPGPRVLLHCSATVVAVSLVTPARSHTAGSVVPLRWGDSSSPLMGYSAPHLGSLARLSGSSACSLPLRSPRGS